MSIVDDLKKLIVLAIGAFVVVVVLIIILGMLLGVMDRFSEGVDTQSDKPEPKIEVQNKPSDCGDDLIKSAPCFSDAIIECRQNVTATINTAYGPRTYKLLGIQDNVCKIRITTELGISTVEQECEVAQVEISTLPDIVLSKCVKTGQT